MNNRVCGNQIGIHGRYMDSGNIKGNNITSNTTGILLDESSGNEVRENIVAENSGIGIRVQSHLPENNLVYHNNFSGNLKDAYDQWGSNSWDNG